MKEKSREKKGVKDKKKGQPPESSEKQPLKAKVDELVVSVSDKYELKHKYLRTFVILLLIGSSRYSTRSWRASLATLKTGFIPLTCTEEKLEMTTNTLWMMIGSLAGSRQENTNHAAEPAL